MMKRAVPLCVLSASIALTLTLGSVAAAGAAAADRPQRSAMTATWSAAENLSASGQNATEPQMAMSADAHFQTATWYGHDGVSSNIYVTASGDSGATWSPATMLTASVPTEDAYDPRIAVSAEGRYQIITWYRFVGVSYVVQSRTSSDFGATWAPVVDMSTAGAAAATPSVAMSSDGRYQTITWRRNNGSHNIVQARTSSDFGATWALAVDLSAVGDSAWMPQVDLSADGRYQTITWYRRDAGRNVIQSRSSSDHGVTWATVVDQSAPGQDAYNPRIAVSGDGRYQSITWYRYDGSRNVVQVRSSTDFGATWGSAALDLSSPPGSATMPRIAMSASGQHVTITWENYDGSRVVQVSSSSDYGATWAAAVDLSGTGNNAESPQIALSADGQVQTATWWRLSGGIANVQVVQARTSDDFGVTWAAAVDLSTPTTDSYSPALAMSADGRSQVVAWYLYMGSYYAVQASYFPVAAPPMPPAPPKSSDPPGDVTAVANSASATIAWAAPVNHGSFPITHYRVISAPGRSMCLTTALSCTVTGLDNGTAYTFTVAALTGAGWSAESTASNEVTPRSSSISITGARSGRVITVTGAALHVSTGVLRPWLKLDGQPEFEQGVAVVSVRVDGSFTWSRRSVKKVSIYLADGAVRSNTIVLAALSR